MRARYLSICLALAFTAGLRADVTIRYQTDFKPAASLQPLLEQMFKAAQTNGSGTSIQMKGNKAYTTTGPWTEIFDFVKQEVTLIDPAHKTYASFPVAQLADKMTAAMPQTTPAQSKAMEEAMAQIKTKVDTKATGHTATIQGVECEEREVTLSMELPLPPNMSQPGAPGIRLVMHIWTAKAEEALRNPAIRELTGYNQWQRYILNPAGAMEKIAGKFPGVAATMRPVFEEMFKNQAVIMRNHMEMYMPFLATLAKQMAAQGQRKALPDIDPNAPLMELNQEVAELSSAPVDAGLFEIPKEYTSAAADDLIKAMMTPHTAGAPEAGGEVAVEERRECIQVG